jgi:hypothetical protein
MLVNLVIVVFVPMGLGPRITRLGKLKSPPSRNVCKKNPSQFLGKAPQRLFFYPFQPGPFLAYRPRTPPRGGGWDG